MSKIAASFFVWGMPGMQALEELKDQALYLLRRGWLRPSEIAATLDVTRQTVDYWARNADFDYRKRRAAFQLRCRTRAQNAIKRKGRVNGI